MRYVCPRASGWCRKCYAGKAHDPVIVDGEPINAAIECPYDRPRLVKVDVGIIEAAFETYEKEVIPVDAGPVQRAESKQAFFGGASIILVAILNAVDVLGDDASLDRGYVELHAAMVRLARLVGSASMEATAFADSVVKRGHDGSDKN